MLNTKWFEDSIGVLRQSKLRLFCVLLFLKVSIIILSYFTIRCKSSICWSIQLTPSYVITLPGQEERVANMKGLFKKYANLNVSPFYGVNGRKMYTEAEGKYLLPGEIGLRDSMKNIYTMAIEKKYKAMFVFEDDAIPHRNFTKLFENLPERCREADVLLLGALVLYTNRKRWPFGPCFDADQRTYGSHALYVKDSAFKPIVNWLMETEIGPFDTVYQHLQHQGLKVRVAHPPFLSIQNLNHHSSVHDYRAIDRLNITQRAEVHNWDLKDYPTSLESEDD
ncbi:unnamed protein product [Adineta ricciae]|uniref:Glycosyl transferase family 25 domain-containing protein n=1 Tax=Adineta ricciae TaxID=249248 RepID=A0A815LJS7_ADIRI|nr:unnamed protein product [Adineta ricciae]CAF1679261.1 unnamed protein product [Adineta ricciae]